MMILAAFAIFLQSLLVTPVHAQAWQSFASPPPIGSTTPNTGAFTTLSTNGTSGTQLTVGSGSSSSATPSLILMDSSYSGTAGTGPKLSLYNSASVLDGFGVSANVFAIMAESSSANVFNFYGGTIASPVVWATINSSGVQANAFLNASSAPGLSVCGTGSPTAAAGSSNSGGEFTTGGSTTACTITFANAYPNHAFCVIHPANAAALAAAAYVSASSASAFTITYTTAVNAEFNYACNGN